MPTLASHPGIAFSGCVDIAYVVPACTGAVAAHQCAGTASLCSDATVSTVVRCRQASVLWSTLSTRKQPARVGTAT